VRRKNLVEPGDFEYLPDEAGQSADSQVSTFVSQLLGGRDERAKPHAADVREIAQIDDEAREPLCDAGLALPFKLRGIFGVHAPGYMQHNLIPDLGLFNGHSISRVHHAAASVNHSSDFQARLARKPCRRFDGGWGANLIRPTSRAGSSAWGRRGIQSLHPKCALANLLICKCRRVAAGISPHATGPATTLRGSSPG
jgi:hypothetical protein